MKGRVLVILRPEMPDLEGESLVKTLEDGGLDGVVSVRRGKLFEIELSATDPAEAKAQLTKIASEHLADPATEKIEVLVPGAGPEAFGVVAVYDRRQDERRQRERRAEADRRSGRDRRLDALAAKERAEGAKERAEGAKERAEGAKERAEGGKERAEGGKERAEGGKDPDDNRRTGSERRDEKDRRDFKDRRDLDDRRAGMERRSDEERRTDDEDISDPERRGWIRRRVDQ